MIPIELDLTDLQSMEGYIQVVLGKNQPEYTPLPALLNMKDGSVITQWEFTADELQKILDGGNLKLTIMFAVRVEQCPTCNQPIRRTFNPVKLQIVDFECGFGENAQR